MIEEWNYAGSSRATGEIKKQRIFLWISLRLHKIVKQLHFFVFSNSNITLKHKFNPINYILNPQKPYRRGNLCCIVHLALYKLVIIPIWRKNMQCNTKSLLSFEFWKIISEIFFVKDQQLAVLRRFWLKRVKFEEQRCR